MRSKFGCVERFIPSPVWGGPGALARGSFTPRNGVSTGEIPVATQPQNAVRMTLVGTRDAASLRSRKASGLPELPLPPGCQWVAGRDFCNPGRLEPRHRGMLKVNRQRKSPRPSEDEAWAFGLYRAQGDGLASWRGSESHSKTGSPSMDGASQSNFRCSAPSSLAMRIKRANSGCESRT